MKIVIIDDENYWLHKMDKAIRDIPYLKNLNIQIVKFKRYDEELRKILYDNSSKIYIIDIQLRDTYNGYDIVHEIRDIIFDWKSIIILASIHDEMKNAISQRLAILTYISKNKYFNYNLAESIKLGTKILANNKFITIKEGNKSYQLVISDIIKVTKETTSKYSIIETINNTFRVRISLKKLNLELNFIKENRSTLINPSYVSKLKL